MKRTFYTESTRRIKAMLFRAGYEELALTDNFKEAVRLELEKLGIEANSEMECLGMGAFSYTADLTDEEAALVRLKFFN